MKTKYLFFAISAAVLLCGCNKWLDVDSKVIYDEKDISQNPELAEAQFLTNYAQLRKSIQCIGDGAMSFNQHHLAAFTDDGASNIIYAWGVMRNYSPGKVFREVFTQESGQTGVVVWNYKKINTINKFIQSYKNSDNSDVLGTVGEAYFIRAYLYFEMVKRYGGVPLVSTPIDDDKSINNRATEEESWNYVRDNLDSAIMLLPKTQKISAEDKDRANRYTALALKSRAMLYAATIAEYGSVINNGLQGIPATSAERYFREAAEAALEVVNAKKYTLTTSFENLFNGLDEDNNEIIFRFKNEAHTDPYVYVDYWNQSFKTKHKGYTSFMVPPLDIVEQFETLDGNIEPLDYSARKEDVADFFKNRDKRLNATVIYPGGEYLGYKFSIYRKVIVHHSDGTTNEYAYNNSSDWSAGGKVPGYDVTCSGEDGIFLNTGAIGTTNWGFFLKKTLYGKRLDNFLAGENEQDAVIIRYGEVVLNLAEAAEELLENYGDNKYVATAQTVFDELRKNHGGLPGKTMTIDIVRHERRMDLLYEGFRYWDQKRWRIGVNMHNTTLRSLNPILHIDESVEPASMYYTIEQAPAPNLATRVKWFEEKDYYCPVPISQSPGITQNIGWE